MMKKELLIALDVGIIIAAIVFLLLTWYYLPRESFMWSITLAILTLFLSACVNVHYVISTVIEARRKASGKTGYTQKLPWLTILNSITAVVILAVLALFWFYMPHDMAGLGVLLTQLIFLLIVLLNAGKLASDYIDSGKQHTNDI